MIKPILTGVWVCAATMGSAYLGAAWQRPAAVTTERQDHGSSSSDSTPVRTRMISVPVVADAVDEAKQRRLTRLALSYMKRHDLLECSARFDVVAVTWPARGRPTIEHFKSAFEATGFDGLFS